MKNFFMIVLVLFICTGNAFATSPDSEMGTKKSSNDSGLYVSGTLGHSAKNTVEVENETVEAPYDDYGTNIIDLSNIEFGSESNVAGFLAIGKRIGKMFRVELEYGFRGSDASHLRADTRGYGKVNPSYVDSELNNELKLTTGDIELGNAIVEENAVKDVLFHDDLSDYSGGLDIHSLMANFYTDFNEGSKFRPYLGAGLGIAWANYELVTDQKVNTVHGHVAFENEKIVASLHPTTQDLKSGIIVDQTATSLGYQFMAGLGYEVAPKVVMTAGYRLFGATGEFDTRIHSGEVGVRYNF